MSEWKVYKVGEKCLVGDGAHASIPRVDVGIPYLSSKNFKTEGIDLSDVSYISPSDYEKHFRENSKALTKPKSNDIILSIIGSIGAPYLINPSDNFGISSSVAIIRPSEQIVSKYLFYYLKTSAVQNYVEAIKSGAAQGFLSLEMIKSIPLTYPELPIQHRIASILSAYDDLIENNNRRIALLEQMAEQIYKEWFVRMRFPGYENTEFEKGVPEGWEWKKVEDVFKTSSGGTPSRQKEQVYYGGNIDWIKTGELKDTFIFDSEEKITDSGLKNSSAKLFPPFTLLMAMYGVNIGQLGISVKPSSANQAVCVFSPRESEQFSLYYAFFFFKSIRSHLFNISMGAAQQNLSQDIIKRLNYLKPKTSLLLDFESIQKPMFYEILKLSQQNQILKQTRDLLLPRLISGKLRVKDAEKEMDKM